MLWSATAQAQRPDVRILRRRPTSREITQYHGIIFGAAVYSANASAGVNPAAQEEARVFGERFARATRQYRNVTVKQ